MAEELVVGLGGAELGQQLLQGLPAILVAAQRAPQLVGQRQLGRGQDGLVVPGAGAGDVDRREDPGLGE